MGSRPAIPAEFGFAVRGGFGSIGFFRVFCLLRKHGIRALERHMAEHAISILRAVPFRLVCMLIALACALAVAASEPADTASAKPAAAKPKAASAQAPAAKPSEAPAKTAAPAAPIVPAGPASPAPPAVPGEARIALSKAIAFHREAKDLSLKFRAKVYNAALDTEEEYQGRLLLKGDKFRLEIPGGTYVSDGKSFWEYHPKTKQAILKQASEMEGRPLPGDVLLRFLDSDPLSLAPVKDGGKEYLEMRLDPSRAMKNLDSLAVRLDKRDYSLHRVSSRDVSGNEARYTVVSVKRNAGLKDKEFAFTPPKGAEVVDMREQ